MNAKLIRTAIASVLLAALTKATTDAGYPSYLERVK
jgi:hypothetical protein